MRELENLVPLAQEVVTLCQRKGLMVATAESCTGGLIAGVLTEVSGASAVFDRGFVTYSNDAKMDLLRVLPADLNTYGAVSEPVARAMALGALSRSRAQIAVSVTGIAGPTGGTEQKPVGTVHFGLAVAGDPVQHRHWLFPNNGRDAIRALSVKTALELCLNAAESVRVD